MKTIQEIKERLDFNKEYLEKYGEDDWMKAIRELLKSQISVLEWVLDIEKDEEAEA